MKKFSLASIAILFICALATAQKTDKQKNDNDRESIEGNGQLVTREIPVTSFEGLKAKGVYELKLSQGSKESVKIEADENLQQYFDVRNEGSTLVVGMKDMNNKNWKVKNKLIVYVTFRSLKALDLSTVGGVTTQETLSFGNLDLDNKSVGNVDLKLTATKLDLENKGVGNLKLTGKASEAVVKNKGVGNLNASEFVVQTMDIDNSGIGSAEVNAEKDLKVKDSFLGKVKNKGTATARKMNRVRV